MTNDMSTLFPERPQYLYKYCTAKRAAQILRDQYIYLAPISRFNDLFEFSFFALLTENEETPYEYFKKNLAAKGVNRQIALEETKTVREADIKSFYEQWKSQVLPPILRKIREHSGVTCFSAKDNHQRMWATYADNHQGVCLEFAVGRDGCPFEGRLLPVIYSSCKTGLTFCDLMNKDGSLNREVLIFLSMIKHQDWRDENEWRVLFLNSDEGDADSRKLALSPGTISRVFLGPRISDSDETKISDIVNKGSPNIPVIKCTVDSLYGKLGYEGFEVSSFAEGVFYWLKKLNPGLRDEINTLLEEKRGCTSTQDALS